MRELFTTLFVFAAAFMLWRTMRPQRPHEFLPASSSRFPSSMIEPEVYKWPSLGLFSFAVTETDRHQSALKSIADGTPVGSNGARVQVQLHTGSSNPNIWKPVEIRAHGQRLGYLSHGDASRFQRRLAYEGRAGQVTSCDAVIVCNDNRYDVRLDLKEFRH